MSLSFIVFLNCACVGVFTGFASDLMYFIKMLFKNNHIVKAAIDFCVYFIGASFVFVIACNINNNIFSFYEIIGFVIGTLLQKISCGNLIAKFFDMLYNKFTKILARLKKSKLGSKIFK